MTDHRSIIQKKLATAVRIDAHIEQSKRGVTKKLAYRIDDACYAIGIGRTSLYAMAKAGQIKLIKIAGRTLVPHGEIERLISIDREA